jgi:DNA-binding response OmpR family regulator
MLQTETILAVDDDPSIAALIAEVLTDEGYTVRLAYDASGALAAIAAQVPNLVLADLLLPRMSGLELLRMVRAQGHADLPIILMTAATDRAADLTTPGAAAWLAKPFDIDELLACVERFVSPRPIAIAVCA